MADYMTLSYREKGDKWVEQVDTSGGTIEDRLSQLYDSFVPPGLP